MADLGNYSGLFLDDKDKEQQQQGQQSQPTGNLIGGSGSNQIGSGSSQPQSGTGGQSKWTNIQSYLGANPNNTGSSQLLNNFVGSQINSEKNKIDTDSNNAKNTAQTAFDQSYVSQDKAKSYLDDYSNDYTKSLDNNTGFSSMKSYLGSTWDKPTSYTTGVSKEAQGLGSQLKDNYGFDNLMNQTYSNAAGKQLNRGMFQLQKQLDVNNDSLNETRNNLTKDYDGLSDYAKNASSTTTKALEGLRDMYNSGKTNLTDYLNNRQTDNETQDSLHRNGAQSGYQFNRNQSSGRDNAYRNFLDNYNYGSVDIPTYGSGGPTPMYKITPGGEEPPQQDQGATYSLFDKALQQNEANQLGFNNKNANWNQIENEVKNSASAQKLPLKFLEMRPEDDLRPFANYFSENKNALNNFKNEQKDTWQNAGRSDRRSWNAIADILGQSAEKKKEMYDVLTNSTY